ncbi:MAG: DUF3160 domain-containing protein [Bacteroidales bacterium]|nr:DUF3160 domain-containing protein [Bacteroidales bacterium]
MKYFIWAVLFMLIPCLIRAQSDFDSKLYMQFLESNQNLTAEQLLSDNPPKTTYYASRTYPAELDNIPWLDSISSVYGLTSDEKELLADNHFVVSQRLKHHSWISALINVYASDLPLFLSADFVLCTLHNSYDAILQTIELKLLEPNLIVLLESIYKNFPVLYNKYKNDMRLNGALSDVDLYISVAYSLLTDREFIPQFHTRDKYDEVMQAVDDEQLKAIALFTDKRLRKIDFSQFKPRGHYTKTIYTPEGERNLENYFRAMMWLGRIDFLLTAPPENPWESDWTVDELRRMQLGAVLLNELLHTCGKKDLLDTHEKIITFLVGPDDNLTPDELKGLTNQLLGNPADLFDEKMYEQFMDTLDASDDYGQKIMSNFFYVDPRTSDPGKLPVSFELLGQKFLLDSYITSEVVYDRIIYNGKKIHRGLPDPLDVMTVLGNEDAMVLLNDELEKYKYAYKISSLKYLVDAYDEDFWSQSLYNTWLASLRELNPPASADNLPYFMQTTAWHHEKLNTQLTSWAELRHDNILYGKQSYTGATGCSYPYTYIEPYPAFYERIQLFAENAAAFFQEIFIGTSLESNNDIVDYYSRYAEIMELFKSVTKKELSGIPLNEAEITFLKTMINEFMASGPSVSGWLNDMFYDNLLGLSWDFVVADIHTQPTDEFGAIVGYVYHVGNGFINNGVFLAPNPVNPDQLIAYTGPVASFHYEVTDNFYRYTDQEWQEKFFSNTNVPERPDWVSAYLAGSDGEKLPEGRELKGTVYGISDLPSHSDVKDIDYLLAFPNPASDIVHLRFILNRESRIHIALYSTNGSLVRQLTNNRMLPAEHDIPIDLSDLHDGLYVVRFMAGDKVFHRKIMVQ